MDYDIRQDQGYEDARERGSGTLEEESLKALE